MIFKFIIDYYSNTMYNLSYRLIYFKSNKILGDKNNKIYVSFMNIFISRLMHQLMVY